MMMCEYPKCDKEATERVRLQDPDCEGSAYCKEHAEIALHEARMAIFGLKPNGRPFK